MISKKLKTQDDINAAIERAENAKKELQELIEELKAGKSGLPEQWKPDIDEEYLYIDNDGAVEESLCYGNRAEENRLSNFNVFKPEDRKKVELLAERQRLDRKMMQYVDQFVTGNINWTFGIYDGALVKGSSKRTRENPYIFSTQEKRDAVMDLFTESELKLLLTGNK